MVAFYLYGDPSVCLVRCQEFAWDGRGHVAKKRNDSDSTWLNGTSGGNGIELSLNIMRNCMEGKIRDAKLDFNL